MCSNKQQSDHRHSLDSAATAIDVALLMPYGASKAQRNVRHVEEAVEMSSTRHDTGHRESSSAAPLIEHETDETQDENELTSQGANVFLYLLTLSACIGGLLFGYDTGVVSATLVSIGTDLSSRPLSSLDKGLITSSTSFFALVASPLAGLLADRYGRKNIIALADVLFVFGALWQALTSTVGGMIAGRSLVGLAIGGASMIVPLYIAELAPGHLRGRLITLQLLLITGGQAAAYVIGYLFSTMPSGWRWMVGLGAAPAMAQIILLASMPETPRFLAKMGQEAKARQVLSRVYNAKNSQHVVDTILAAIKVEITQEEDAQLKSRSSIGATSSFSKTTLYVLFTHPPHLRALTVACLLQGLQQLCGFNVLMYFSGTIFQMLGFHNPILASLSIALTNFAFTIVAFFTIDRLGRRRSLLSTIPIMILGLCTCALAFHYIHLPTNSSSKPSPSSNSTWPPLTILLSLTLYVASYATGLGPIPWQQSELFPLPVRSLGSALSTATNWSSNTLVGLTFLPMLRVLTPGWTFAGYALVCAGGWVAVWAVYPETSGVELEEVGRMFECGFGVEESVKRFERRGLKGIEREDG